MYSEVNPSCSNWSIARAAGAIPLAATALSQVWYLVHSRRSIADHHCDSSIKFKMPSQWCGPARRTFGSLSHITRRHSYTTTRCASRTFSHSPRFSSLPLRVPRHASAQSTLTPRRSPRMSGPLRYLLILDFEATCGDAVEGQNEIIEFPTLVYDLKEDTVLSTFHEYVRPVIHPTLTPFCIDLTGITQVKCILSHDRRWVVVDIAY